MTPPKIYPYHQFFLSTTGQEKIIFEIEAILDDVEGITLSDPKQDVWVRVGSQYARPSWTQSAAGALNFIRSQMLITPPCIQFTSDGRIFGIVGGKEFNGASDMQDFVEAAMRFYKLPAGKIKKLMEWNFPQPELPTSQAIELPAVTESPPNGHHGNANEAIAEIKAAVSDDSPEAVEVPESDVTTDESAAEPAEAEPTETPT